MWIGWIEFDVLLGDVHSLKGERAATNERMPLRQRCATSPPSFQTRAMSGTPGR